MQFSVRFDDIEYETYDVPGCTADNVAKYLRGTSQEYAAYTSYRWKWKYNYNIFKIRMKFKIYLPAIDHCADEELKKSLKNLHCHELGHVKIAKKVVKSFLESRLQYGVNIPNLMTYDFPKTMNKAQTKFDEESYHGCTTNSICPVIGYPFCGWMSIRRSLTKKPEKKTQG